MNKKHTNYCFANEPELKLLDAPKGFTDAMKKNNLVYQMRYSVDLVERQLEEQGNPHVLQLVTVGSPSEEVSEWTLYADGHELAYGNGRYARNLFETDAEAFMNECRRWVENAPLETWTNEQYRLLRAAAHIALVLDSALVSELKSAEENRLF